IHLSRVPTWMPKSLAIWTSVTPASRFSATRTTSSRNSLGNGVGIGSSFQTSGQLARSNVTYSCSRPHRCSVGWGAASLVCGGGGGWGGGIAGAAQVGGANPGLRQYQVDIVGGLLVAGQGGGDGADLLVAGGHQKRRGSAVAFH